VNPTIVCPRGCNVGFGPITNDFETLGGKGNDGMMIMTVTAECSGCGLLCDNEIEGPIDDFKLITGPRGSF
jgi:hypothetical protein